jgi:hypothetical protein
LLKQEVGIMESTIPGEVDDQEPTQMPVDASAAAAAAGSLPFHSHVSMKKEAGLAQGCRPAQCREKLLVLLGTRRSPSPSLLLHLPHLILPSNAMEKILGFGSRHAHQQQSNKKKKKKKRRQLQL